MTSPRVAVVDHGMGNLRSVAKALEAAGASVVVTADAEELGHVDVLCVPGQGIFDLCMSSLGHDGWDQAIAAWVRGSRPYLGICLGMQVLFGSSDEGRGAAGLGLIEGSVRRLEGHVKIPHIGWNTVEGRADAAGDGSEYFYFDHSFAAVPEDPGQVTGWCHHGDWFAARIETGSLLGVQFHPEKSGRAGIALLQNWLDGL